LTTEFFTFLPLKGRGKSDAGAVNFRKGSMKEEPFSLPDIAFLNSSGWRSSNSFPPAGIDWDTLPRSARDFKNRRKK